MALFSRQQILQRLQAKLDAGQVIVGAGAGTGISAKMSAQGGADLLVIYNSGRFRMAGRGSLSGMMPYGDANAIVMEMASEVIPVVSDTPVHVSPVICRSSTSARIHSISAIVASWAPLP